MYIRDCAGVRGGELAFSLGLPSSIDTRRFSGEDDLPERFIVTTRRVSSALSSK